MNLRLGWVVLGAGAFLLWSCMSLLKPYIERLNELGSAGEALLVRAERTWRPGACSEAAWRPFVEEYRRFRWIWMQAAMVLDGVGEAEGTSALDLRRAAAALGLVQVHYERVAWLLRRAEEEDQACPNH